MFYPEKLKSIKETDKVLEIGPGNTPFFRSNVFLERNFSERDAYNQSGKTKKRNLSKKIVYYDGHNFPFDDGEFNYLICSHVLEHIPYDGIDKFIQEIMRVANAGYIEVPLFTYEILCNIPEHLNAINIDRDNKIWITRKSISFDDEAYRELHKMVGDSGIRKKLIRKNREKFVFGFEWHGSISYEKVGALSTLKEKNIMGYDKMLSCKRDGLRFLSIFNENRIKQMLYNRLKIVMK